MIMFREDNPKLRATPKAKPRATPNAKSHSTPQTRSSVLVSDDGGATWLCSAGTAPRNRTWGQWEPTVFEPAPGVVLMVERNNDFRLPADGEHLQWRLVGLAAAQRVGLLAPRLRVREALDVEDQDAGPVWTVNQ